MPQIPSDHGEAVLKCRGADPDIFHPDRLSHGLERSEQIARTHGFRLTEGQNLNPAQNLVQNPLPEALSTGNAGSTVS